MTRAAVILSFLVSIFFSGCPDDKCHGNDDCIDGYACTKNGSCIEVDPLTISNNSLPDAVVGVYYQVILTAKGGIVPYVWIIETDETWLSIQASTGVLGGNPSGVATGVGLKVFATDGSYDGQTVSDNFTIDILYCSTTQDSPCHDHGECSSAGECTCDSGYDGNQCETCADGYHLEGDECVGDVQCDTNSCSGHGDCGDSTGTAVCTCYDCYEGAVCSDCTSECHDVGGECLPNEVCIGSSCHGHGDCDDSTGVVFCSCYTEYEGQYCDECADGHHWEQSVCVIDEECPVVDPCSGHGDCDDSTGIAICTCDLGYDGDDCKVCAGGYHPEGGLCVLDENCLLNSCTENGTCDDSTGLVVCTCYYGYTGQYCDECSIGYVNSNEVCLPILYGGYVPVEARSFMMGSPEDELGANTWEEELHPVVLTNDFEIMVYETVQADYEEIMGYNPSYFQFNGGSDLCPIESECPVENLNWYESLAFANQVSILAGLSPCYSLTDVQCDDSTIVGDSYMTCFEGRGGIAHADMGLVLVTSVYECSGYRLPTEAEWEYAIRAGSDTAFYNGDITVPEGFASDPNLLLIAWYLGCTHHTNHVGLKVPNAWGLYDMSGNVKEWVWDCDGFYPSNEVTNPEGPVRCYQRMIRGGYFQSHAKQCRSASRYSSGVSIRHIGTGIRLARTINP